MISFNNTEIAFKSKTDRDLNKAYWLFKIVGNPSFVKIGKSLTNFSLKAKLPIKGIIKSTIFHQFCGGETIAECEHTALNLAKFGIGSILDYSIEGKTSDEDFDATVQEIVATIEKAKHSTSIPYAVFKVTGISRFAILEKANDVNVALTADEQKELAAVIERIDTICKKGFESNIPVFIDAEESWIQDTIDRICHQLMEKYNKQTAIVFNTAQMYRHDRLNFIKEQVKIAQENGYIYGVKLVRGAYMEKERERAAQLGYPSPIQPDKAASDRDYNLALAFIIEHIDHIHLCAGSHNEESASILAELIEKHNLEKNDKRIYFAQLLGMSDHISYNVANAGFNVAKYVPYGPIEEVMPYLLRRADENTSVAGQTGRELNLIIQERTRRKQA